MHKVFLYVMGILDQGRPPLGVFSGSASKISHRLESADDLWSKGRFEVRRVRKGPWLTQRAASRSLDCGERQHDSCEEPGAGACFWKPVGWRIQGGYMCGLVAPRHQMYENVHFLPTNPPSR